MLSHSLINSKKYCILWCQKYFFHERQMCRWLWSTLSSLFTFLYSRTGQAYMENTWVWYRNILYARIWEEEQRIKEFNLTTINNIWYHRVCVVFGIYSFVGKRENTERSIKVINWNYIIIILLLQLCYWINYNSQLQF